MKVSYLELKRQFSDPRLWEHVSETIQDCGFILGPEVEKFERAFADLCGTTYALGVNSGTDAIFLSLKALGVGQGDEVITAPNSFLATVGAIVATGATPVFVDVGSDYNINPDLIQRALTKKTRAILPIHLTGKPADMEAILTIAESEGVFVVEDACQAVLASVEGRRVGSFGTAGCFSLHPLKNLNVCGDGGVITTSNSDIYENLRLLRNHGLKNRDEIEFFAYNSRLDSIQASVANYFLQKLETITEARIRNAQLYDQTLSNLDGYVTIPSRKMNVKQVFHTYVIRVKDRNNLVKYLNENGIETKIHYPIPIHLQKPCAAMGYQIGNFPECEQQSTEILTLPIHQYLSDEQILYVCDHIKKFYRLELTGNS